MGAPVVRTASYGAPVTASYGAPVVATTAPMVAPVAAPVISAPVTSTISYAEPLGMPSRGYLLLSPADREEMLKEKYTWDEVYKLLNRGGLPGDMQPNMKKKQEDPAYIFEQHRLRTRKSVPLMEAVQRRIDRAAQAVSETCLDGAETKRVEAVRMSGGEDRSALERKRILLDLAVRCLAPKGVDPVTGADADGEVAKYFGKSR